MYVSSLFLAIWTQRTSKVLDLICEFCRFITGFQKWQSWYCLYPKAWARISSGKKLIDLKYSHICIHIHPSIHIYTSDFYFLFFKLSLLSLFGILYTFWHNPHLLLQVLKIFIKLTPVWFMFSNVLQAYAIKTNF